MAAASYNTDLTDLVADSSSTNNWAALGGGASGLNVETDYFIEGTRCISKNAFASSTKGMVEDTTNTGLSSGSGNAVYLWVTHATPGSLDIKSNGGIAICLGSASNSLNRYYYAGSDTIDYGAPWICAVVNPDDATANSGTVTVANMDTYGAEAKLIGGPTKGAPFGIDEIRYGHSIEINDGVGAAANFTDLAVQNDGQTNRWGQFQRTPGSAVNFTMQCRLEFGDTTNTTACEFDDSGKTINIPDLEHVATDFIEFDVTQSSDVTLASINFVATAGANTRGIWTTTSAANLDFSNCVFSNFGASSYNANTAVDGNTYTGCEKITANQATFAGARIDSSTVTGDNGAILTDSISDITDCTFIRGAGGHAIELDTAGNFNTSNTFTGYAVGTVANGLTGTAADAAIYVTVASGTVNINVTAGTTPSIRRASGSTATINVTGGGVTIDVTVIDESASPINLAYVYIDEDLVAGGNIANVQTNASGVIAQQSYNGAETSATLRIRKYGYKPYVGSISLLSDQDARVTLIADPQQY